MYLSQSEILDYKVGFDFSQYTSTELSGLLEVAESLINDYIGYEIKSGEVEEEEGNAVIQNDGRLYVNLKGRKIEEVSSLKIFHTVKGSIDIDVSNIELHKNAGYFYTTNNGNNLSDRFNANFTQNRVPYRVSYSTGSNPIPAAVKLAMAKITGNLLRADINMGSGAVGEDGKVKSFVSGDYSVKFDGSSINYKGKYNSGQAPENSFIDDSVKILLHKLRRTGQNTY